MSAAIQDLVDLLVTSYEAIAGRDNELEARAALRATARELLERHHAEHVHDPTCGTCRDLDHLVHSEHRIVSVESALRGRR